MSSGANVTVIITTYNRPAHLTRALRTVAAQSHSRWTALVIGDACDAATGNAIAAFDDPRVRYVNLPERFGEQAGPTSVGLELAETPIIAFLNHDDLWLPDHLSAVVEGLERGADVLMTRSAFYRPRYGGSPLPLFYEVSVSGRTADTLYDAPFHCIEPFSSWAGRADVLRKAGRLELASTVAIPPIQDYVRRVLRTGAEMAFPDALTSLKSGGDLNYADEQLCAETLATLICSGDADAIHDMIQTDLWLAAQLGGGREGQAPAATDGPSGKARVLHDDCGIDLSALRVIAEGRAGWILKRVLPRRTGEQLGHQPDIAAAVEAARDQLS